MSARVARGKVQRWCRVCGWKGTYDTAAKADYARRRHSCEKHQKAAASRERGEQRRARIDRTPKPCHHKHARHVHGTRLAYVLDKCRCLPCAAANAAYERDTTRQKAYGRWNGLVDAEPARAHIQGLMDAGMGLKQIIKAGISSGTLTKLLYGYPNPDGTRRPPARRIRPATAERLLAVELAIADHALVDATGTVRRVRALVALGWSQSKIAAELGILRSNFHLAASPPATVNAETARAVAALYDRWSMTLPPAGEHRDKIAASRARRYAAARHWPPPLALDDDRLDDPTYQPEKPAPADEPYLDEAAIYRRTHGDKTVRLTKAEKAELVRRWSAAGRPLRECERITGVNPQRYTREDAA